MPNAARKLQDHYTYGDYRHWPDTERGELIGGVAYIMTAS